MKTTIKEITPQWASQILETRNPRNRRLSETFVAKLARDISCNAFATTHQGIAFDENGDLLDGQHRLAAVVVANKPITIPVTTDVPASYRLNGSSINTFELIDGGKSRGVGQMLQMAGFANGNRIAAVVKMAVLLAHKAPKSIGLSTAQTHKALLYFRKDVESVVAISAAGKIFRPPSYITGPCAIYHSVFPDKAEQFLREVGDVTGESGSASRALAVWAKNHVSCGGGNMMLFPKVAASGIWHSHHGNKISKLYTNDEAMAWLLGLNKPLIFKLSSILD